jgi:hypothetical protein
LPVKADPRNAVAESGTHLIDPDGVVPAARVADRLRSATNDAWRLDAVVLRRWRCTTPPHCCGNPHHVNNPSTIPPSAATPITRCGSAYKLTSGTDQRASFHMHSKLP